MTDKIVVLCTVGSAEEGERIARTLIEKKLAACVNLTSEIRSIYFWQGALQDDRECLLVIKSQRSLFEKIRETILSLHSYEVPEILALPIVDGSEQYLAWMDESTSR